jgi:tRNA1(Val) A37 N6-methylase TrmN6
VADGVADSVAETTTDGFLGGRLRLTQPKQGYRAGADAVLLAAAGGGGRVLDAGAGVGTVGLCLAWRRPDALVTLLERDPELAALAEKNARGNGLAERVEVVVGDIRDRPVPMHHFDEVLCNPPFFEPARAPGSGHARRRAARTEDVPLADWIGFARAALRPGGALTLIHRMQRLPDILAALPVGVTVFPLWPRQGDPAKSVLVRWVKDSDAPLVMAAGLVLHEAAGGYTKAAEAILRSGDSLPLT